MEFYVGQIFEEMYPPEAAEWCNENNAQIIELEPKDDTRQFQIEELKPYQPTELEIAQAELCATEQQLKELDYIGIKIATGRATIEEYKDQIAVMSQLAEQISELRKKIKTLSQQ